MENWENGRGGKGEMVNGEWKRATPVPKEAFVRRLFHTTLRKRFCLPVFYLISLKNKALQQMLFFLSPREKLQLNLLEKRISETLVLQKRTFFFFFPPVVSDVLARRGQDHRERAQAPHGRQRRRERQFHQEGGGGDCQLLMICFNLPTLH